MWVHRDTESPDRKPHASHLAFTVPTTPSGSASRTSKPQLFNPIHFKACKNIVEYKSEFSKMRVPT